MKGESTWEDYLANIDLVVVLPPLPRIHRIRLAIALLLIRLAARIGGIGFKEIIQE